MNKIINVGLVGCGKLGSAVAELFCDQEFLHHATKGRYELKLHTICEIDKENKFLKKLDSNIKITKNFEDVIDDPEINIVIEVIGGKDIAYEISKRALSKGKFLVNANKSPKT